MNINILLPYKEEYDNFNSGAVSIFVKDQLKFSKLKNQTFIYGISSKKKNIERFITLPKSKYLRNLNYVKNFSNIVKKEKSIIELHNRPQYFIYLKKKNPNNKYCLYIHNDPLGLKGSKSIKERKYILENCNYLIFISEWIKNKFFTGLDIHCYSNYEVIYHGSNKIKKIPKKKILFFFAVN